MNATYVRMAIIFPQGLLAPEGDNYAAIDLDGAPAGFMVREGDILHLVFFNSAEGRMRAWGFLHFFDREKIETGPLPAEVLSDYQEYKRTLLN